MLQNFFQLNGKPTACHTAAELKLLLTKSKNICDLIFYPDKMSFADFGFRRDLFQDVMFHNVSFRRTEVTGIIFRNCTFIDCLFVSSRFVECEFHDCEFIGSNPHKFRLIDTYIDPEVFVDKFHKVDHWNIGIWVFQQLYNNATNSHQPKFARSAEYNMRKWERYELDHKAREKEVPKHKYYWRWSMNILSWIGSGYGVRPGFLLGWAALLAFLAIIFNFACWDALEITDNLGDRIQRSVVNVAFYTANSLSGFGSLTPESDLGKLAFVGQSGFGLTIIALFLRWFLRLTLR